MKQSAVDELFIASLCVKGKNYRWTGGKERVKETLNNDRKRVCMILRLDMIMGKSKATPTHSLLILSTRSKPERVAAIGVLS